MEQNTQTYEPDPSDVRKAILEDEMENLQNDLQDGELGDEEAQNVQDDIYKLHCQLNPGEMEKEQGDISPAKRVLDQAILIHEAEADEAHQLFLANRLTGIGGSDAAAIAGMSDWSTPLKIYMEKKGLLNEAEQSEPMFWGSVHEDTIARVYSQRTGHKVRRDPGMRRHKDYPWMIAHLDRIILNSNMGLECKTCNYFARSEWGEEGTDQIPKAYLCQVQHYMAVTGYKAFELAVLIGGNEFRIYHIERNDQFIADLINIERNFWQAHVEANVPPDAGAADADSLAQLYGTPAQIEIVSEHEIDLHARELNQVKSQLKNLGDKKSLLENKIKEFMGNAEVMTGDGYKTTWKSTLTNRLDSKALKEAEPEIAKRFTKLSESRRFLVKFQEKVA